MIIVVYVSTAVGQRLTEVIGGIGRPKREPKKGPKKH
jgi:hypothetical protein